MVRTSCSIGTWVSKNQIQRFKLTTACYMLHTTIMLHAQSALHVRPDYPQLSRHLSMSRKLCKPTFNSFIFNSAFTEKRLHTFVKKKSKMVKIKLLFWFWFVPIFLSLFWLLGDLIVPRKTWGFHKSSFSQEGMHTGHFGTANWLSRTLKMKTLGWIYYLMELNI